MSVKKCSHCGKELPEELQFCPYCMERTTEPIKATVPADKKKLNKKSIIIIIVAIVLFLLLAGVIALFNHYKNDENDNNNALTEDVNTTESADTTESTSENENLLSVNKDRTQENPTDKDVTSKEENKTNNNISSTTTTTNNAVNECNHNWVAITETVHHDEVGHYEMVEKQRKVTKYKCPVCYEKFASLDEYYKHFDNTHKPSYDGDPITILREQYTTEKSYEYYTTEEWVVDKEAYDETVITGYKCSICEEEKTN